MLSLSKIGTSFASIRASIFCCFRERIYHRPRRHPSLFSMHGFLYDFTEPFVSALPVVEAVAPLECLEDRRVIDGIGSSSAAAFFFLLIIAGKKQSTTAPTTA
jgi:hypothetical protein